MTTKPIGSWMSNPQYLAQVGHTLGGAWVVFLCGLFGGLTALAYGIFIGVALALLKEFVFDLASWGEADSLSDSVMDFAFYILGAGLGTAVYFLAEHLHRIS